MAFYTAEWVRKLVKEDHVALQKHISNTRNDFRSYIDMTLPFTLYLDIDDIRRDILKPNSKFIEELTQILQLKNPQLIIDELDSAYKKVINYYIDSYENISSEELSNTLQNLSLAIETGNIKSKLQTLFKNTVVIKNLSKRNKSVLILSPKFTTIQSKFGSKVKENFDLSKFSDYIDDNLNDSPRNIIKNFLDKNYGKLSNLGHKEVDIISNVEESTEVKRGLVTPRLLQAIMDWPKDSKLEPMVRKFSKETGQAETRIKVRKKFTGTKLVLEMLIEAGIMIGGLESQEENLLKAPKEKGFLIGQGLTARIINDPSIITNLETSKSINQFLVETVIQSLKGKKNNTYNSITDIVIKSAITKEKVSVKAKQKAAATSTLPKISTSKIATTNLAGLQLLLDSNLQDIVSANMGMGNERGILNYQTGRFAASVKVERLSESRQGMITAFYTYMKNPYQTFEPGFRQGSPRSRDPKLLISKSIRELAATMVGNRLRAVQV